MFMLRSSSSWLSSINYAYEREKKETKCFITNRNAHHYHQKKPYYHYYYHIWPTNVNIVSKFFFIIIIPFSIRNFFFLRQNHFSCCSISHSILKKFWCGAYLNNIIFFGYSISLFRWQWFMYFCFNFFFTTDSFHFFVIFWKISRLRYSQLMFWNIFSSCFFWISLPLERN